MLLDFDDDGPGPVVVLLHGFPLDRSMWHFQRSTVGAIYRVISPDLRGHGTSAAPEGIYTVDEMADDVIETLDSLHLTRPLVLGGLSMGGYVALSIATRYPGRVKGLMLLNTRASTDTPEAAKVREQLARQVEAAGNLEALVANLLPRYFARAAFEHHPHMIARVHHQMARTPARAVAGTIRGLAIRPDRIAQLPEIKVPSLVVAGSDDQIIPADEIQTLVRGLPDARLVTIEGAGHLTPLEKPEETSAAILSFLESVY